MATKWRAEMAIDGGIIDDDHKCLIGLVNEMESIQPDQMPPELGLILVRLGIYVQVHFEREERLQIAAGFTDVEGHQRRHGSILRRLDAMCVDFDKLRDRQQTEMFRVRLHDFLNHWLIDQILKADLAMKPFVKEMGRHKRGIVPLANAVRLRRLPLVALP
jgi:hemerythrin-like metal-binding protein